MNEGIRLWGEDIQKFHNFLVHFGEFLVSEGFPEDMFIGPATVERNSIGQLMTVLIITTENLPFVTERDQHESVE